MASTTGMEMGAMMMDAREATKGLDGYAETLLSLSTLLKAGFCEEKSDQHEALLAQIKQEQINGRWIANEIIKDLHSVGAKVDQSGDLTGINAALQRYVAADVQAKEALIEAEKATRPNEVSEALRKFKRGRLGFRVIALSYRTLGSQHQTFANVDRKLLFIAAPNAPGPFAPAATQIS